MSISSASLSSSYSQIQQLAESPDLLLLHRLNPERYPYLLASTASGSVNTRYDILFACPQACLELRSDHALYLDDVKLDSTDFLDELNARYHQAAAGIQLISDQPFSGGWFVYLGYELAGQIEPVLKLPQTESCLPVAFATRIPCAIIHDKALQKTSLVCEQSYAYLQADILQDIQRITAEKANYTSPQISHLEEEDENIYITGVNRIKQYIIEGDVFQVNLSRAWHAELQNHVDDADIFHALSKSNPAPFAGLVRHKGVTIISSSPERLVHTNGNLVETRPIAGTRPRGANKQADDRFSDELLAHPKERAEHIMLIDLERNDLGRICIPGTVRANELMVLESYAHVHHIVSNVQGTLRPDILPGDVIRAVFPGGTITGCPKVRCMEIIAELEHTSRDAYTGSMGYLEHNGNMDLNILIRTMTCCNDRLTFRAGAGIVADSIAENEVQETRAKARGMLLCLTNVANL